MRKRHHVLPFSQLVSAIAKAVQRFAERTAPRPRMQLLEGGHRRAQQLLGFDSRIPLHPQVVTGISAKGFITAVARKDHGYMLSRQARDMPRRNARTVTERFAVM